MRSYLFGALAVASLSLVDRPVNADTPQQIPANPLAMTVSGQCDSVRDLVVDTLVHQLVVGYGHGYNPYYNRGAPVPDMAPAAEASEAPTAGGRGATPSRPSVTTAPPPRVEQQPSGPRHYTTTNVQERGVDEADIVKTDGKFVYTLRNNELLIAKTWPVDKTDITARLKFKTLQPQQLYLHGNQIIVQGYSTQQRTNPYPYGSTRMLIIDASDRMRPKLRSIYDVDGSSYNSRVVGDDLYLVQNGALQIPPKLYQTAQKMMAGIPRADQSSLKPWEIQGRLAATLRRTMIKNLTTADIQAMLPSIYGPNGKTTLACDQLFMPPNNMQLGLTSVARISLTSPKTDLVGAMVAGGQIYASTEALYVTAPSYNWNQNGYATYSTQVHQFSLRAGKPAYVASGNVDGQVLNQFSMSEHNGDLRIATTDWNWSGQQGGNHLFVLRPRGTKLEVIGALRGLAKGERIYSGRMFGDKGYLVTFRQTDPLFTLDLRDPTKPRVVGELKINGFSSYIHPMGNDLLLTIGQDATSDGRVTGMHLQVFDVGNPANPTRRFHETFSFKNNGGYSYSAAQHDHKAFTYDPVTRTLALPLTQSTTEGTFQGLVAYHIDPKRGFKSLGRIDHRALADKMLAYSCQQARTQKTGNEQYFCNKANWPSLRQQYAIDRSIVVDKYLMSLGTAGLMIHKLAGLDQVAQLSWARIDDFNAIAQ